MSCVSFSRSCQKGGGMGQHVCESANGKPPISKKGYMDKNETERNLLRYTCAICSELSTVHSYCSRNQSGSRDLQWFDCNVTDVSRGSGGGGGLSGGAPYGAHRKPSGFCLLSHNRGSRFTQLFGICGYAWRMKVDSRRKAQLMNTTVCWKLYKCLEIIGVFIRSVCEEIC